MSSSKGAPTIAISPEIAADQPNASAPKASSAMIFVNSYQVPSSARWKTYAEPASWKPL